MSFFQLCWQAVSNEVFFSFESEIYTMYSNFMFEWDAHAVLMNKLNDWKTTIYSEVKIIGTRFVK